MVILDSQVPARAYSLRYCLFGMAVVAAVLSGCASDSAPEEKGNEFGTAPQLVEPSGALLPTVNPAKAIGWSEGTAPEPAPGLQVNAFARDLEHPRWLLVLPNGDVLVAETNAPQGRAGMSGIKFWIASKMMSYAGAGVASPNRITLLRDADGDGTAEFRSTLVEGLNSPFGMAVVGDFLYVANADELVRFPYQMGDTRIDAQAESIAPLPGKELNHHWTKNLLPSVDGQTLYVAVGSNSNIAENGLDAEHHRAAILAVDTASGDTSVFASGLRNPVGMAWEPVYGALWTVVNERDELGDQLVPDYLTEVEQGAFYGWPYSYWGSNVDQRVAPQKPDLVAQAREPDYALGAHTASLGLAFYTHSAIPSLAGSAIIGQHGSWNRAQPSGYKVIAVSFDDGKPMGAPTDLLSSFLNSEGEAQGRPVGVAINDQGAILVADDVGNIIWRIAAAQ